MTAFQLGPSRSAIESRYAVERFHAVSMFAQYRSLSWIDCNRAIPKAVPSSMIVMT